MSDAAYGKLMQAYDTAEAENERLRAALEKIAGGHGISTELLERAVADKGLLYGWCQSIARAALADSRESPPGVEEE